MRSVDPESTETFQLAAAFTWQKSQWVWEGTTTGAICHHNSYHGRADLMQVVRQETTTILFQNISVIAAMIRSYARWEKTKLDVANPQKNNIEDTLFSRATEVAKKASKSVQQLMEVGEIPVADLADGYWNRLSYLENITSPRLGRSLRSWEPCIAMCYELGISVPTLPSQHNPRDDIQVAALMLKRTITDLRVVWKAVSNGYIVRNAICATL